MKIVFCGPPHSGKSVFIANLIAQLPSDGYTIIRACPDGEGTWSNNKNQKETSIVRKKGKFTQSFIDNACKAIDNQTNKIVLVDVGGVMSKENEQVFQHCDSFVVLSSDEEKKKEWLEFGQKLGLQCIGCLDSSLEGQEEIYSKEPYFSGKIVGLERGEILNDSPLIKGLVSDIVKKSKYTKRLKTAQELMDCILIDGTELGFELGYEKEILMDNGRTIKKIMWKENAIGPIYKSIKEKVNSNLPIKIKGIMANFALTAVCKSVQKQGVTDISCYDIRSNQYIPIRNLPKKKGLKQSEGLAYNIIENKENIFMDIDITKEQYSFEDYQRCILPKIKEEKNLFLSGRMPLWLLASISNSYDSNKIFTFQPGKGFTCIASADEKELGKIIDGADGININQYFEDKQEKSKLPIAIKKQNIFSKLREIIANKSENSKYIDKSIVAKDIAKVYEEKSKKEKFKSEIEVGDTSNIEVSEQKNMQTVEQKDKVPTGIGG